MTYDSKFNYQSEKLINPAYLCLILSIIVHVMVLKFGLPNFNSEEEVGKRKVSVIELSPEQQSRLPNLSPQLDTPKVPEVAEDLPPIDNNEPAPSFAIPRSLIPGIGDPSNLPPINIPPPPNFDFPDLPPITNTPITDAPITDITLPPIGNVEDLPLPPEINLEDFKIDPTKIPPPTAGNPVKPNKPTKKQPQTPSPTATNNETAKPETKPKKKPKIKQNLTPKPVARKVDNSSQRITNLQQSLTKNDLGTTDEEARKNYVLWLAKVKEIEPKEITVKGIYPRDACIRRLKGNTIFGVVVNDQGTVVALDLLKGSSYPIFNKQGRDDVGTLVLDNQTKQPKPYRVKVEYEYDSEICPSLTLPSIRKAEEKPTPAPESKPKPAPKPKPESKPASEPIPESEITPIPTPKPKPQSKPTPESIPETEPEPKPTSEPTPTSTPEPKPESRPTPEPTSEPSLKDRLRDIKLPNRNPSELRDIPLPDKPNFNK